MTAISEQYDSICHFNPTADALVLDPSQDCGQAARWHFLAIQGDSGGVECYQACDVHQGRALLLDGVEEFHEFGSACGLEGSYWVHAHGTCATEVTMVTNGMAWYEVQEYERPSHPLPGTYIKETDTGKWYRFVESLWVEVEPPVEVK